MALALTSGSLYPLSAIPKRLQRGGVVITHCHALNKQLAASRKQIA